MTPDPISVRIDTLHDIIFALHAGAHMRRRFTAEELQQLVLSFHAFEDMLKLEAKGG